MLTRATPSARVLMISALMALAGSSLLLFGPHSGIESSYGVAAAFVVGFAVSEAAVFHLEIRGQAHTFSLGESVIVIGLFFVNPVALALARILGALIAMLLRHLAPVKVAFNLSLALAEVAVAGFVFSYVSGSTSALLMAVGSVAAVGSADLVGVGAVWTAIAIFEGRPRRRQVLDVLEAQMFVTLIAGSFGVVGALAIAAGAWTLAFVMVVAFGTIAVFRQNASLTTRYTGLRTLHDFSRAIADDLDYARVLKTAMTDLVDIVSATSVVGLVLKGNKLGRIGLYRVVDGEMTYEPIEGDLAPWRVLATPEPKIMRSVDVDPIVLARLGLEHGQVLSGNLSLGDVGGLLFVATKTSESVGRFDAGSVEQVGAMARYVSATLRTGIMVEEIEVASRRDDLTGLANRVELERVLDELGPQGKVGVVVLFMDNLWEINDALGHGAGDEVVLELAGRLDSAARGEALVVARLDGASFAVAYDADSEATMVDRASHLIDEVDGELTKTSFHIDVRCVAGVAIRERGGDDEAGVQLIRWADLAVSHARRSNRTVGVYSPELDDVQQRRLRLVGDLRRAITNRDFELWYQPKVSFATGEVRAAEALIRWRHNELGPISPDEFITLAETTGLITDITEWVVGEAVGQARLWLDQGIDLEIAVNLSTLDLLDANLADRIGDLLEAQNLAPGQLGLEVTETAIMRDQERVVANLERLAGNGHRIYIDDYGTGQSSLAYLRALPVTALKIDRSFIADLGGSEQDEVIVRSTIDLAHSLGMSVVAEGLENVVSFDRLRALGCDSAQGYFLARPMPAPDFEIWMQDVEKLKALLGYSDTSRDFSVGSSIESREVGRQR